MFALLLLTFVILIFRHILNLKKTYSVLSPSGVNSSMDIYGLNEQSPELSKPTIEFKEIFIKYSENYLFF